jgi:hypothetical protein
MKPAVRAIVYAPVAKRSEWIERELVREEIMIQTARSIVEVIAAVVDDPPPRPQILVLDFDSLSAAEVLELHSIRERGWFGTIFALGKVPVDLRKSLRIEQVLGSLVDNSLRVAVSEVGFDAQTRRLPIFNY